MSRRVWPRYSERCPGCQRLTVLFPFGAQRFCLDCRDKRRDRPTLLDVPTPPKEPSS